MEFWTLDGLERSGRPVGIISTYFRQKRSGGFRVMTKTPIIFTTIKFTSIEVWAYKQENVGQLDTFVVSYEKSGSNTQV